MSIKVALATKLKSITALTAKVDTRIYSVKLPQDFNLPAVTFRVTDDRPQRTLEGHSGKTRTDFEIIYNDKSDTAAETGGDIIWKAIDGFSGTVSDIKIQSISLITRLDEYDYDINVYQRVMVFKIGHIEATT